MHSHPHQLIKSSGMWLGLSESAVYVPLPFRGGSDRQSPSPARLRGGLVSFLKGEVALTPACLASTTGEVAGRLENERRSLRLPHRPGNGRPKGQGRSPSLSPLT